MNFNEGQVVMVDKCPFGCLNSDNTSPKKRNMGNLDYPFLSKFIEHGSEHNIVSLEPGNGSWSCCKHQVRLPNESEVIQ